VTNERLLVLMVCATVTENYHKISLFDLATR